MNLVDETLEHFVEGAKSVRAYTDHETLIITRTEDGSFWIAKEEPGFAKQKTSELTNFFVNVFGIEAHY